MFKIVRGLGRGSLGTIHEEKASRRNCRRRRHITSEKAMPGSLTTQYKPTRPVTDATSPMITPILAIIAIMIVATATPARNNEIIVENQLRKQWLSDMPSFAVDENWYDDRQIEMVKNWKIVSDDPREHQVSGHQWYGFTILAQNVDVNTCTECQVIVGKPMSKDAQALKLMLELETANQR